MIHEVFCYLRPDNAEKAIAFYAAAFGATEKYRLVEPGTGRIGHAELALGPFTLMLSDAFPESGITAQSTMSAPGFALHLHVDDADAVMAQAEAAGATILRPAADQFYGERGGTVRDPFGYEWIIGHTIETVTPEDMQRRYDAAVQA